MCMIRIGDGGSARHGVKGQRVGVLEENEALDAEFLDPLGDNPVLRSIHSFIHALRDTDTNARRRGRAACVEGGRRGERRGGRRGRRRRERRPAS